MFRDVRMRTVDNSPGLHKATEVPGASNQNRSLDKNTVLGTLSGAIAGNSPLGKDSIFDSVFKGFMGALANPVLLTTGREALATVDAYGKTLNTPQNLLGSVLTGFFGDPSGLVSGIVNNPQIMKMTDELITTGRVSSATSNEFIKGFGNNILSGVQEASAPWLKDVTSAIGLNVDSKALLAGAMGLPGSQSIGDVLKTDPTISMLIKGEEYVTSGSFDKVQGLFRVVENLTSSNGMFSNILDIKAELQLFNTVTKSLMLFNSDGLITKMIEDRKRRDKDDPNKTYTTNYLLDNVDNAVYGSSFEFMESLLKEIPASKVLDTKPNFIYEFLSNFTLKNGEEPSVATADRLIKLLSDIDPNWNKTTIAPNNPNLYTNIAVFKSMSNDANKLFLLKDEYLDELALATYYPAIPLNDYLKRIYPLTPIS